MAHCESLYVARIVLAILPFRITNEYCYMRLSEIAKYELWMFGIPVSKER